MIVGEGTHQYELVEGWAKVPAHIKLGYTHGVVTDKQDRVFVHNRSKDSVVIFDRDGNFIKSWGEQFAAGAHGMYLSNEGGKEFLFLADPVRHIVVKTTLDGEEIFTVKMPNLPEAYKSEEEYKPTDVAVAPNGDFYVCDGYGQSWIHQYDKNAKYIRSWGGKGAEPGKMSCPHGIWIDTRRSTPEVYVADRSNNRIQVFTLDGKHVRFVQGDLRRPCCFFEFKGDVVIPDLNSRVTILDKNDKLITHLGDMEGQWNKPNWPNVAKEELHPGKFSSPHAACVDSHGDLYVVEWISDGRITKLRRIK
jgi:DNA-binding beta-propeller fold protein YncE